MNIEELIKHYKAGERNFLGVDLHEVSIDDELNGINLSHANLSHADLSHINLGHINIANANFVG
jgi:uncharacterized protein YjbI with pentapeptide repeats